MTKWLSNVTFLILSFQAPTGKPVTTVVHNTSSSSIYISWKPPPLDTILGEFLGYRITYRARDSSPQDVKEIYIRDNTVEVSLNSKKKKYKSFHLIFR